MAFTHTPVHAVIKATGSEATVYMFDTLEDAIDYAETQGAPDVENPSGRDHLIITGTKVHYEA